MDVIKVDRGAVRAWVEKHRNVLEVAQASGALARTKLDLRDAIADAFPSLPAEDHARLLETFDQEMEALCQDLRLATVTVQQQVEREVRKGLGVGGWILLLIVGVLCSVIILVLVAAAGLRGGESFFTWLVGTVMAFWGLKRFAEKDR